MQCSESSNSPKPKSVATGRRRTLTRGAAVWLCRLIVGIPFVVSGWAKAVDPAGFVIKLDEYMNVWQLQQPHEILLCAAIALAMWEFTTGVCLVTGMLRRAAPLSAAAMMAVMLPLTVWIALKNPVSDCGCFGDLWVLSNTDTLIKNIIISVALVALFVLGCRRGGTLYRTTIQWVALLFTVTYIMYVALRGYNVQPMVDFRPYPVGTDLAAMATPPTDESDDAGLVMVYTRNGVEREFPLDSLPDDTWTYVRRGKAKFKPSATDGFAIFDEAGQDVASEVLKSQGYEMLVIVPEPGVHYLRRQRQVNELARIVERDGGSVIGLAGISGKALSDWTSLVLPDFDFYSADDTTLKALVRGDAAIVMLHNGRIVWKRSVPSLRTDFVATHPDLASIAAVAPADDGRRMVKLTAVYIIALLLITPINAIGLRRKAKAEADAETDT